MKLFALAGVASAALIAVGVAAAQTPEQSQSTFDYAGSQDCGAFVIEYEGAGTARETVYFDGEGNPIRIQVQAKLSETDVNTTTLKSLVVRSVYTEVFDLVAGTFTISGMRFMSNDSGYGSALQDTGRIAFNPDGSVDIHGPHEVFETQGEIFCEALS